MDKNKIDWRKKLLVSIGAGVSFMIYTFFGDNISSDNSALENIGLLLIALVSGSIVFGIIYWPKVEEDESGEKNA